jgi:hypothetical protein
MVLRDAWQRLTPLGWRGGSGASGHVVVLEPSLCWKVGSSTVVARGSMWTHTLPFVLA